MKTCEFVTGGLGILFLCKMIDKNRTVLITGATGLLGIALLRLAPKSYKIIPTFSTNPKLDNYRRLRFYHLDVTSVEEINNIFETFKPNIVIHCAGIGNVDFLREEQKSSI